MVLPKSKLILFAVICGLSTSSSFSYASFPDVTEEHQLKDSVDFAEEHEIIVGYPDGTFRPDDLINRAEFTKILMKYAEDKPFTGRNCFPEVTNEWFAQYVCTAQERNFVSGYPDGTFRPGNAINFAEVAKIVVNSLEIAHRAPGKNEEWFVTFIRALDVQDAIPTSIKSPEQLVTRAELTDIIHRLFLYEEKLEENKISTGTPSSGNSIHSGGSNSSSGGSNNSESSSDNNESSSDNNSDTTEDNNNEDTNIGDNNNNNNNNNSNEEDSSGDNPGDANNDSTTESGNNGEDSSDTEDEIENEDLFTLESEIQLSFSLLDIFEPKEKSHATLNIGGTEYRLSVEPEFEKYTIERIAGDENLYKIVRTVDKQTFANSSQTACEGLSGSWESKSICLLGSL